MVKNMTATTAETVLIFDLDNTLYPASSRLFDQIDARMTEYVAKFLSLEEAAARHLQKKYFHDYGTTLTGLMRHHDADPHHFMDYVHDIDLTPLPDSSALEAALAAASERKVIFTNGSVRHAENILSYLGIAHYFTDIFDIAAAAYMPKPALEPYQQLVKRFNIIPQNAIMLDDIPRNLEPAAALGMRTVWVQTETEYATLAGESGRNPESYIHETTEDVAAWLAAFNARSATSVSLLQKVSS